MLNFSLLRSTLTALLIVAPALSLASDSKIPAPLRAAETRNTEVFSKFGPAVVGIVCKGSLPNGGHGKFSGTGAVISADGMIISNVTTVPPDASDIKVYFTDGHVRSAQRVQVDEKSEGALVKVEGTALPFMHIADSTSYKVGDPVFTWGNPFSSIQTDGGVSFSSGNISGLYTASSIDDQSSYLGPAIETDAAVNPGSDGGPLTDTEGNLIGVISLAYSRTRWLGLAIPTSILGEKLSALKPLMTAKRSEPGKGALSQSAALHAAFEDAAKKAGPAVITLRVVREKDDQIVPLDFKTMEVKADTTVVDADKVITEDQRPDNGFATAFLVSPDGKALTAYFNVDDKPDPPKKKHGPMRQPVQPPDENAQPDEPKSNKVVKIYAFLPDGKRVEGHLLGAQKAYDLALIKLDLPGGVSTPYLDLAASPELQMGSSIAVLGRSEPPGGLTMNEGRVSSTHRLRESSCQINSLLNYGNTGGPVIDLDGKVVGMAAHLNTASEWRQNCGVGFMLNTAQIRNVLPELSGGKTIEGQKPGFLGVRGDETAVDVDGARISKVMTGSAAEKAGILAGDLVVEYNGKKISDWLAMVNQTRNMNSGDTVKIKLKRAGQTVEKTVTLGEY